MARRTVARPYHIEVVYHSGYVTDFWCADFSINLGTWSWTDASPKPLVLGVDHIESVWLLNPDDKNGAVV